MRTTILYTIAICQAVISVGTLSARSEREPSQLTERTQLSTRSKDSMNSIQSEYANVAISDTLLNTPQTHSISESHNSNSEKHSWFLSDKVFQMGMMLGTDIGGAIPMPLRYVPSTFNPYPQLNLSIGVFIRTAIDRHWDVEADLFYKTVGMKADARVDNQKYEDKSNGLLQYYTGTANMDMSFTMFELPIFATYKFSNGNSKLLFGPYLAFNIKSKFETLATKGYAGERPGHVGVIIEQGSDPLEMDFTGSLRDMDAGVMLGFSRTVYKKMDIGVRVSMGFCDIFKNNNKFFDYKMLNMRGSLLLSYRLFN